MCKSVKAKNALKEFLRAVVSAAIALVTALMASSCGSLTKATIRNGAESTTTSVTITTNNPSTWNVDPNLNVDFVKPKKDANND